jgi:O-antigen ligase
MARQGAEESTEWRLQMWKSVAQQIPEYLFLGKGYNLSGTDLYMLQQSTMRGYVETWESHALAGDYHSGPLSVIISFGIWGVLAFAWLLYAGTRHLYQVYRDGAEQMKVINRFLLALFVARILFFVFVFGALYSELYYFTGILGLSVALNSAYQPASPREAENEVGLGVSEANDIATETARNE